MISIEEVNDRRSLQDACHRWKELLPKTGCEVPYLKYEWYASALETIDRGSEPFLLFFRSGGEDIGFAPLVRRKQKHLGLNCDYVTFVHNPYTPYQRLVYQGSPEEVFGALFSKLGERCGGRFALDLNETRFTDGEASALKRMAETGLILLDEKEKTGSRYLPVEKGFEEVLGGLKSKTKKEFQRKNKRLAQLGAVDLIKIEGERSIREHLENFFKLYEKTWKGAEPQPEFYYGLCESFDRAGSLHFYALTLKGAPIAYLISLQGKDVVYGIKTTYDPAYYDFSPGIVMFYKCIEEFCKNQSINEFDIGRGEEQFKKEWTSLVHRHTRVTILPSTLMWRSAVCLRDRVIPCVQRSPLLARIHSWIKPAPLNPCGDINPDRSADKKAEESAARPAETIASASKVCEAAKVPSHGACEVPEEEILSLVNSRAEARRSKDWPKADSIRDMLLRKGVEVEDQPDGTVWRLQSNAR